ncbi:MAG: hypothetical protein ACYDCC_07450 [Actinomycetota bacterium]
MSISNAQGLLSRAATESNRVIRHLLVAASVAQVLSSEPIVVGGVAEDFYTGDNYRPTDLDMCAPISTTDRDQLRRLGFQREGRHWFHEGTSVALEFPEDFIDGSESRTQTIEFDLGSVRIIGLDDLYLDRLRQSTMTDSEGNVSFIGAVAIAAARFEELDWSYIRKQINRIRKDEPMIGEAMARHNRRVRRRARAAISD